MLTSSRFPIEYKYLEKINFCLTKKILIEVSLYYQCPSHMPFHNLQVCYFFANDLHATKVSITQMCMYSNVLAGDIQIITLHIIYSHPTIAHTEELQFLIREAPHCIAYTCCIYYM